MNLLKDKTFRKILLIFLITKIFVFSMVLVGMYTLPEGVWYGHFSNKFIDPFLQYDGKSYIDIAMYGYHEAPLFGYPIGNYQWFPFFPILIKIFSYAFGYGLAAFLIPNICFIVFLAYLYLLFREEFGRSIALKTAFYLMVFPTAYFFSMAYTESLFVMLVVMIFYYTKQQKWWLAGILGFLASITKLMGVLIILPVLYEYLRFKKFKFKKIKADILYLALIPLGLVLHSFYMYITTGDFLKFLHYQTGKTITWPWMSVLYEIRHILNSPTAFEILYASFNIFIFIIFLILLIYSYKKLETKYNIYDTLVFLVPLFSSTLEGIARFVLPMFPVFAVIAMAKNKKLNWLLLLLAVLSTILMGLLIIRHTRDGVFYF